MKSDYCCTSNLKSRLGTTNSKLSVYRVNCDQEAKRAIVAVSVNTGRPPDSLDYALLDEETLNVYGFAFANALGDTPDETVNGWHRDLVHLSGLRLAELAKLWIESSSKHRLHREDFVAVLRECVQQGFIERAQLSEKFRAAIDARDT